MENLHFSDSAFFNIGLCGAFMILIPAVLLIIFKIKTKAPIAPVIAGAVTFFLFAIVLKSPLAYLLYQFDGPVSEAINSSPLLYYMIAGLLAGIFEETGTFLAFKTALKKDDGKINSLAYGIGHGGFESIYIAVSVLSFIPLGIMINSGDTAQLTQGLSQESEAAAIQQISQYASMTTEYALLSIIERISAIAIHISLSVLVFKAAREKSRFWLYPLAVLIHALIDFSLVLSSYGMPLWGVEIILAVMSFTLLILSIRLVYKRTENSDISEHISDD